MAQLTRRAELSDLVRYAGASLDFNPIHWNPEAAKTAGLDDCVVHGMLIMGWIATAVAETCGGPAAISGLKVRFRAPLYVGKDAVIEIGDILDGKLKVEVRGGDGALLVSGSATCCEPA